MQLTSTPSSTSGVTGRPLSPHIGAEIIGVDPEKPISDDVRAEIYAIWIEAGVILFRNVHTNEAQMRLSQLFGELRAAANADLNSPDNPYLMERVYDPDDPKVKPSALHLVNGVPLAGWIGWHWDQAFMPEIVRGAALRMQLPPREGGRTGFIDAIAAYDRLSEGMKARIDKLEVVYEFNGAAEKNVFGFPRDIKILPGSSTKGTPGDPERFSFPPTVHPMVITQPETGRKVLKLSPMHARYILDMDRGESDRLLHEIADHLIDDRFAYYHDWQVGDLLLWDNWRTIHCYTGIPLDAKRRTTRTTIAGDYKVGRYLDQALADTVPRKIIDD